MSHLKILVLSDSKDHKDETIYVTKMFENGLDIFHLRKPEYKKSEMEEYLDHIPHKYRNQIVIHSYYDLAIKYGLKGIHLSKRKRREGWWLSVKLYYFKLRKPDIQISTSFHHLGSLFEETRNFNYVLLSPIFDSISKSGYQSGFSHQNLKLAMAKSRFKIIALGGVEENKIEQVNQMGFWGFLLSGIIWESPDPVATFNAIFYKAKEVTLIT